MADRRVEWVEMAIDPRTSIALPATPEHSQTYTYELTVNTALILQLNQTNTIGWNNTIRGADDVSIGVVRHVNIVNYNATILTDVLLTNYWEHVVQLFNRLMTVCVMRNPRRGLDANPFVAYHSARPMVSCCGFDPRDATRAVIRAVPDLDSGGCNFYRFVPWEGLQERMDREPFFITVAPNHPNPEHSCFIASFDEMWNWQTMESKPAETRNELANRLRIKYPEVKTADGFLPMEEIHGEQRRNFQNSRRWQSSRTNRDEDPNDAEIDGTILIPESTGVITVRGGEPGFITLPPTHQVVELQPSTAARFKGGITRAVRAVEL